MAHNRFLRGVGVTVLVLAGGLVATVPAAVAKPAWGGTLTAQDLKDCMGLGSADPRAQVDVCTRILKSGRVGHPHQSDYMAWRAGAYLALGRTALALADLDKAIALQDLSSYRFQRALVHMARGDFDPARADLGVVTKATPDFAPAYFMRGAIAYRQAAYPFAVTSFDMAVSKLPTYYQAIYARGLARMKVGEEDAGRKDLATARGMSGHVEKDIAALGLK
jgi:tetratricopeptide (TPR) repeat protein